MRKTWFCARPTSPFNFAPEYGAKKILLKIITMPTDKKISYKWQVPKPVEGLETIECREYDQYRDFKRDPAGFYVLIRVNSSAKRIEAAICDKKHAIIKAFRGRKSQDVYNAIFEYEKKNKTEWFKEKSHIAYLGKELKKAELALVQGNGTYWQE